MRTWLLRRVHACWHIAACAWGIIIGAAIALTLPNGIFYSLAWLLAALAFLTIAIIRRSRWLLVITLLAGGLFGLWRGSQDLQQLAAYQPFYKQQVSVQGRVAEDIIVQEDGKKQIRLSNVHVNGHSLISHIWVETSAKADIKRGDITTFTGNLGEGFGNIAATMYRAQLVHTEHPQPGDVARRIRDWFADNVRLAIPEPQASLGIGYLTGQRSTLPQDLGSQLQILGLTHVVVASGYNLTILVRLARQLFEKISRYLSAMSAGMMILAFMSVTGLSPSMSRAGLVAGLSLLAWYYGRTIHPFVLLPFAAAITICINPAFIWGDIGWYLSFMAFAGVIILAPLLHHYFWGQQQGGVMRRIFIETSSAQLATMPIIALTFSQLAPLALPANLLILPLIPLTMLLTFIAGIGTIVLPALAPLFGLPASLILQYMTGVTDWLAQLPLAQAEITFTIPMLITSYLTIIGMAIFMWRKTKHSFAKDSIIA